MTAPGINVDNRRCEDDWRDWVDERLTSAHEQAFAAMFLVTRSYIANGYERYSCVFRRSSTGDGQAAEIPHALLRCKVPDLIRTEPN